MTLSLVFEINLQLCCHGFEVVGLQRPSMTNARAHYPGKALCGESRDKAGKSRVPADGLRLQP
jgi:hypothetical protein